MKFSTHIKVWMCPVFWIMDRPATITAYVGWNTVQEIITINYIIISLRPFYATDNNNSTIMQVHPSKKSNEHLIHRNSQTLDLNMNQC